MKAFHLISIMEIVVKEIDDNYMVIETKTAVYQISDLSVIGKEVKFQLLKLTQTNK